MTISVACSQPDVSVCIANYNGEKMLDACISSIRMQQFDGEIEIIVHDDASTDASLLVLAEHHPDVIVLPSSKNVGYCVSNNRMVAQARGRYLLLLNNDATLRQGGLSALVAAAEKVDQMFALTLPQYDKRTGALVDRGVRLDFLHTPFANLVAGCRKLAYVQGACFFMRQEDWKKLGGFPDWMQSNVEDTYLCALIRLAGGRVMVVEHGGYDHFQGASFGGNRMSGSGLSSTYRRRYLSERNRASLVLVCTPGPLAWILYLLQLASLVLEGMLVSALKLDWKVWGEIYWPAATDSLGMFDQLKIARRRAQQHCVISAWEYLRILAPFPHKLVSLLRHGVPSLR